MVHFPEKKDPLDYWEAQTGGPPRRWDVLLLSPRRELSVVLGGGPFQLLWLKDASKLGEILEQKDFHALIIAPGPKEGLLRDVVRELKGRELPWTVAIVPDLALFSGMEELPQKSRWTIMLEPQHPSTLASLIERALEGRSLSGELQYLRHREPYIYDPKRIVAESPSMKAVIELARKVAPSDATVLIQGETGTGKELVAAAIHFNSLRRHGPFLVVNCASLHEELLESELFGHEKGAFTGADRSRIGRFEQAHGGTLFLDEVAEMSPRVQAKILRVLQERCFERLGGTESIKVDVRILASTNRDLMKAVEERRFRKDLYYRLSVVPIHIPPLRQRPEDILPLANFFLSKYASSKGCRTTGFDPEAQKALLAYSWPGNVRELENVVERAVAVCRHELITPSDLMLPEVLPSPESHVQLPPGGVTLREVEKSLIIQALERTNWVQRKAARLLGISPRALHYKLRKHKIPSRGRGAGIDRPWKGH